MNELLTQQIFCLLTESSELGAKNFHVFSSESTLRNDLDEIFSYANDLNFTLSIATNGTHLNLNSDWIQKLNPFIGITIHGSKEFHDSFCQKKGYTAYYCERLDFRCDRKNIPICPSYINVI